MADAANNQAFISYLTVIANKLSYYTCLLYSSIAFVSNIINIIICLRKKLQKSIVGLYNVIISIFNILSITVITLIIFPTTVGEKSLITSTYYGCILISYILQIVVQMSSWLNLMSLLDRMICIVYPNHEFSKFFKNKTKIALIILAIFAFICVMNVGFLRLEIIDEGPNYNSSSNETNAIFKMCASYDDTLLTSDIISHIMRTLLPVVLEFILNTILITKLIRSRKNLNVQRSLYRDYKFAFTIVILNVTFLVTQTPFMVAILYEHLLDFYSHKNFIEPRQLILANFWLVITGVFASYMFGSIFFVNLIFNRIFKKELFQATHDLIVSLIRLKCWFVSRVHRLMQASKEFNLHFFTLTNGQSSVPVIVSFKSTTDLDTNVYSTSI